MSFKFITEEICGIFALSHCLNASIAILCHFSAFFCAISFFTAQLSVITGIILETPNSVAFWITIALWIMGMVGYGVPLVVFLVILSFSWLTKTVTDQVISHAYGVQYGVEDYLHMK